MAHKDTPVEVFKRALAHAARSLAEQPDLEVRVLRRRAEPGRPSSGAAASAARSGGSATPRACAASPTRWPCAWPITTPPSHARGKPSSADAALVYDALEQARIEAIGANALAGVRGNLAAAWDQAARAQGLDAHRSGALASAALADVVGLIARERLTGAPPPDAARGAGGSRREDIEARGGAALDRLEAALEDQTAFARIARS